MSEYILLGYYPLFLIIVGTVLNGTTLFILCRRSFKETKKQPTIQYMRAIAIFDVLMLYGWNLQHYLSSVYGFTLERYSIASCKIFLFLGYFTTQSTSWLRVFVCLDRYLSLSHLHRTWFNHSRSVTMVIVGVIGLLALLNLHLMLFGCFYTSAGTIDINAPFYAIFPLWDYVNLAVYNCIPFVFMMLLNIGVIYHLLRLHRTSSVPNSRIQHRSLSITSVATTFLFVLMTIPATIAFAFFQATAGDIVLSLLDATLFTYHITSFPLYLITFRKFRKEFIALATCGTSEKRVTPATTPPRIKLPAPAVIKLRSVVHLMNQTHALQDESCT